MPPLKTEQPETQNPEEKKDEQKETIATVKAHFQKQFDEEKKKHNEEIERLKKQLEDEKARHIQNIKDILSTGSVQIPQDEERSQTEEEIILKNMRSKYNLKGAN